MPRTSSDTPVPDRSYDDILARLARATENWSAARAELDCANSVRGLAGDELAAHNRYVASIRRRFTASQIDVARWSVKFLRSADIDSPVHDAT